MHYAPAKILLIDSVSFLIALIALCFVLSSMGMTAYIQNVKVQGSKISMRNDLVTGLIVIWRSRQLRLVVLGSFGINIGVSGIEILFVLFLKLSLGLSASIIGISLACMGIGSLLGAGSYRWWMQRWGDNQCICYGLGGIVLGGLLLPMAIFCFPMLCVIIAQFFLGYGSAVLNIALVTLRQKITPAQLLGRVNSAARVSIMSSLPLGSFFFGIIAQSMGISGALWIAAIWLLVIFGFATVNLLRSYAKNNSELV